MLKAHSTLKTLSLKYAESPGRHFVTVERSKMVIGDAHIDSPSSLMHAGTTGARRSVKEP